MDLKKYLPMEEMAADFEELCKLKSEEEKAAFYACRQERYNQKSQKEKELIRDKTLESLHLISNRLDELKEIVQLGEVAKVISLGYVSQKYFGKHSSGYINV